MPTIIRVPGSTSNMGASFDACGLALSLYLKVTLERGQKGFEVFPTGEGSESMPRDDTNLILCVARFIADRCGVKLPAARLTVENQIPLARGLGSSSAAIMAGVSVFETLTGRRLSTEDSLRYAMHFEEHGDNLAPSLLGGLVVVCAVNGGDEDRSLVTIRRDWPSELKVVAVIPEFEMETSKMRAALPTTLPRKDAVFNIQRAALLQAAIAERRFDFLSEALRDRLHQPYRLPLAPALSDVIQLNDQAGEYPGLRGVALSGAGSTVVAFATDHCDEIGCEMTARFASRGVRARALEIEVDNYGRTVETI